MSRKLLHALAAVAVLLVASLVWAQPATAAPTGLCTTAEWQNPGNFADCARRLKDAAAGEVGCVAAPSPGSPSEGAAGLFTSRPQSSTRSGISGMYSMYGVGGYGLDTYDLGCLDKVKHPDLLAYNTAATVEFHIAAGILGAANGLREWAYNPAGMWGWMDGFVEQATSLVYKYVFNIFGVLMLALIGVGLLWSARQGQMSRTLQIVGWALFVMVLTTGVARYPVHAAHAADAAATTGLATMHRVLGPGPQDIPADKCLSPEACEDNRPVSTRASDVATEAILYRLWLRAMVGSADSPVALKYGPALYDATTLTWDEAASVGRGPALRQTILDQKAANFNAVAAQIRAEDPQAYEHLQGAHGLDRAGAGFFAILFSLAFSLFDAAASVVILIGFLIFRVAIILLPLLAVPGLHLHASAGVRRIFHTVTAAVFNIVTFGAGAGLYLMVVDLILRSPLAPAFQMVVIALVGVLLGFALHPLRHLWHTATGRSRAEDGLLTRLVKGGKAVYDQHQSTPTDTAAAGEATPPGSPSTRPEASPTRPRRSAVATMGAAVAPSVATAAGHPVVGAVLGAASDESANGERRQRPETKASKVASAKRIVAAAAPAVATVVGGPAAGAVAGAAASATAAKPAATRSRPETR